MKPEELKKLTREVINKDKWWDILSRFIDVIRMNVFIVDLDGHFVLPPEEGRFGGRFYTDPGLKSLTVGKSSNIINSFKDAGHCSEHVDRYGLHSFAIPFHVNNKQTIAYMVVGPVAFNRKLRTSEYEEVARSAGVQVEDVVDQISEIRVVSNVMMKSILDLLKEIVRDNVEIGIRNYEKELDREFGEGLSKSNELIADEIFSTVRQDELLGTFLDVALKMANAENGSIMVLDEKSEELSVKVSRGLDQEKILNNGQKIGEGLAGIAAKSKEEIFIEGEQVDQKIAHLLKRDEIKKSLILPLTAKERVFGVLNLNTQKEGDHLKNNISNIKYLTKILASAI